MSGRRHAITAPAHFPVKEMQAVSHERFGQLQRREFLLYLRIRAVFPQLRSFGYSDVGITKVMPKK